VHHKGTALDAPGDAHHMSLEQPTEWIEVSFALRGPDREIPRVLTLLLPNALGAAVGLLGSADDGVSRAD
jgi:hypothetical protein